MPMKYNGGGKGFPLRAHTNLKKMIFKMGD